MENWAKQMAYPIDDIIQEVYQNIANKNVIPVIGDEMVYVVNAKGKGEAQSFQTALVDWLFNKFPMLCDKAHQEDYRSICKMGLKGMSFLNKLFSKCNDNLKTGIRAFLNEKGNLLRLHPQVEQLLLHADFPLIITTSYTNAIEQLLENRYESLSYYKEKSKQDIGNIVINQDDCEVIDKRTIYHLFGKINSNLPCVITEIDFLSYLHCLHDKQTQPERLMNYLKNRYLVALGCNMPDWTFRFLLCSFKNLTKTNSESKSNKYNGGVLQPKIDEDMVEFLSNIDYYSGCQIDNFLEKLNQKLSERVKVSVFLSYSESPQATTYQAILNAKQQLENYFDVYFFPDRPSELTQQYWNDIRNGLEKARYIIPVITPKLLRVIERSPRLAVEPQPDDKQEKGIITEWKYAMEIYEKKYKPTLYSLPLLLDGLTVDDTKDTFMDSNNPGIVRIRELIFPLGGSQQADSIDQIIKVIQNISR
ncbi:SIR2 family protein [Bacteroides sp.]|uniref:SIR2 family protein n=1 Tax=Bacteroides sp. TaxID=29523 RepID=UPI00260B28A1|nr:SIR2 family protein [Bacteroides sp.]